MLAAAFAVLALITSPFAGLQFRNIGPYQPNLKHFRDDLRYPPGLYEQLAASAPR